MRTPRLLTGLLLFASFLVVALLQSWPLPLHLGTTLTGPVGGDTGVYVWNTWIFRHELLEHGRWPFSTDHILPLGGPVDLSLHNYTVFSDLVALPLQSIFGVVTTFNLVYLLNVALAGCGMLLLAHRVAGAQPVGTAEAWLAGLLFACSPFLVARSTAHFSLVSAAPLPFFVWFLDRAWHNLRWRDAAGAGVCLAWAAFSDPYYAVYAGMLALSVAFGSVVRAEARRGRPSRWPARLLELGIITITCIVIWMRVSGRTAMAIGSIVVSMRTLYTPMLVLTLLVLLRIWMSLRPRFSLSALPPMRRLGGVAATGVLVTALLLAPELYALAVRVVEGRMISAPVLWRSSAPGVDLFALLLPNPNHPLAAGRLVEWVARQPGRYEENVASVPWVALLVIFAAWKWASHSPSRMWSAVALFFASLSLGPFLRIGNVETYVPTPWTLLRYVPLIGDARMPARFGVVVILAVSVLFAAALAALCRRYPGRRRLIIALAGLALALELLPAPRRLYPAEVPALYRRIAADARPNTVLELPFGIRDGLSSLGDFTAATQFHQTVHGKPLVGGYLSRVGDRRKKIYLEQPFAEALIDKSEGKVLSDSQRAAARAAGRSFMADARVGWVVIDESRASPALQLFTIETLDLTLVEREGYRALYVTPAGLPDQ